MDPDRGERDLQKEKEVFETTIQATIGEMSVRYDEEAVSALVDDIVSGKVFILGETHGVKENPTIVYSLLRKFKFKQLGMEWDKGMSGVVESYRTESSLDYQSIINSCDGRITAEYIGMLKKIKDENLVESVFYFDDKDSWDRRDEVMAQEIISHTSEGLSTIAVAGSAHTSIQDTKENDGSVHSSMVKYLQDREKKFCVGEIRYMSGKYFNNTEKDFTENLGTEGVARFYKDLSGIYIFELPQATIATVPNPTGIYIG